MGGNDGNEKEALSLGEIIKQQKLDKFHNQTQNRGRTLRLQKDYYYNPYYSHSNHPYSRYPRNNNYESFEDKYCYNNRDCHGYPSCHHNCTFHNHMCNAHLCRGLLQNRNNMTGSGTNFVYNSGNRRDANYWNFVPRQGNLNRAQSCESIKSFMSGRSMRSNVSIKSNWSQRSTYQQSTFSGYSLRSNKSNKRRNYYYRKKIRQCPLNKMIYEQIKIIQEKFAKLSEASPLLRLNYDPPNCKPIAFATSITMNKRFEDYYNKIHK